MICPSHVKLIGYLDNATGHPLYSIPPKRRHQDDVMVREMASLMLRSWTSLSSPEIAKIVGYKTHTGALDAAKRCKEKMDDPVLIHRKQTTRREMFERVFWELGEYEGWCVDFGKKMEQIKRSKCK